MNEKCADVSDQYKSIIWSESGENGGGEVLFPKILVWLAVYIEQIGKGHVAGNSLKRCQGKIMRAQLE